MKNNQNPHNSSLGMVLSSIAGLAVGGLIGAGVALLYAPYSGHTTRAMIYNKSLALKDKAAEDVALTRAQAQMRLNRLTRDARLKMHQAGAQLQQTVEDQQAALRQAVAGLPLPFRSNDH